MVRAFKAISRASSVAVVAIGALVLMGWLFDITTFKSLHPSLASMKANAAVGFLLTGSGLLLQRRGATSHRARRARRAASWSIIVLGALSLVEYAAGWNLGIDEALFADVGGGAYPGRMSPATALNFVLVGAALRLDDSRRERRLADWPALLAGLSALLALLGYGYGVRGLYTIGPFASIALHTAAAFALSTIGLLFSRPEIGVVRFVASDGPGGVLARRMLPASILIPAALGWLQLKGEQAGLYGTEFGLALFASSSIVCFTVVTWRNAGVLFRSDGARRQMEARVLEREEELATTLNSIGDAVIATDSEGAITRMNPIAEKLTGWPLDEARGRKLDEVFHIAHEETKQVVESPVTRVLREGVIVGLANHTALVSRDGTKRSIADSGAPIRAPTGAIRGVVLVFRDLTEERKVQLALIRSQARFARVFESGIVGVVIADAQGVLDDANDAFLEMLGYSREELRAGNIRGLELTPPEWRHADERAREQLKACGNAQPWEKELLRKDGSRVPVLVAVTLLDSAKVVCVVADLSDKKRSEAALQQSQKRFSALYSSGIIGIVVGNKSGSLSDANDAFLRIVGYSREDVEAGSVRLADMTPPEWRAQSDLAMSQVNARGFADPWEKEYFRKDGSRVPVLIGLAATDGKDIIAFVADLTERRRAEEARARLEIATKKEVVGREQAEEALRHTEEQLRHAQKMEAVGRLAGGVAHDFNNVLSVILSYAELILDELKPGEPLRDDINEIIVAGRRAAHLTRQLLMFSRQQVLEPRVLDLNDVLRGMDKILCRLVGEDVEVVATLAASLGKVKVDTGSFEQVIMNLAVNARDAMPTGGRLTIETADAILDEAYAHEHLGVKPGPHVLLAVSDTGVGIDRATQARIFEPFFTTKERGKGTGLGLSTVFGIVQQSGGSIWVDSEPGRGTTFKIYLQLAEGVVDEPSPTIAPITCSGSETILLVEDEEQVRAVARGILKRHGYRVIDARHAGEALLLCEQHSGAIDLLLSDVVMPHMSGPELAKRLATARPTMKILCMSGYTDDAVVRHGTLGSGVAFIQKPFTPETLARKVREVLDSQTRS